MVISAEEGEEKGKTDGKGRNGFFSDFSLSGTMKHERT